MYYLPSCLGGGKCDCVTSQRVRDNKDQEGWSVAEVYIHHKSEKTFLGIAQNRHYPTLLRGVISFRIVGYLMFHSTTAAYINKLCITVWTLIENSGPT